MEVTREVTVYSWRLLIQNKCLFHLLSTISEYFSPSCYIIFLLSHFLTTNVIVVSVETRRLITLSVTPSFSSMKIWYIFTNSINSSDNKWFERDIVLIHYYPLLLKGRLWRSVRLDRKRGGDSTPLYPNFCNSIHQSLNPSTLLLDLKDWVSVPR